MTGGGLTRSVDERRSIPNTNSIMTHVAADGAIFTRAQGRQRAHGKHILFRQSSPITSCKGANTIIGSACVCVVWYAESFNLNPAAAPELGSDENPKTFCKRKYRLLVYDRHDVTNQRADGNPMHPANDHVTRLFPPDRFGLYADRGVRAECLGAAATRRSAACTTAISASRPPQYRSVQETVNGAPGGVVAHRTPAHTGPSCAADRMSRAGGRQYELISGAVFHRSALKMGRARARILVATPPRCRSCATDIPRYTCEEAAILSRRGGGASARLSMKPDAHNPRPIHHCRFSGSCHRAVPGGNRHLPFGPTTSYVDPHQDVNGSCRPAAFTRPQNEGGCLLRQCRGPSPPAPFSDLNGCGIIDPGRLFRRRRPRQRLGSWTRRSYLLGELLLPCLLTGLAMQRRLGSRGGEAAHEGNGGKRRQSKAGI